MKKEKLLAAQYEETSVNAAFAVMGEEEGQKLLDSSADKDGCIAVGAYIFEHKQAKVQFDAVEYEWPCEEHPDHIWVYVHINVEE